jgi:hypothetical protein
MAQAATLEAGALPTTASSNGGGTRVMIIGAS